MTSPGNDYDPLKLFWQVEALKGQLYELERERNRTGNLLHALRGLLIQALMGLGVQGDFTRLELPELAALFQRTIRHDWRFSRCPNAALYRCRPSAMQFTRDGDIIHCEDCGWHIMEQPLPVRRRDTDDGQEAGKEAGAAG